MSRGGRRKAACPFSQSPQPLAQIDGRFYRKKYNAQQVLAPFAQTARDKVDITALQAELLRAVQETMQPNQVSI